MVKEQNGYLEASGLWVPSDGDIPVAVVEFDLEATDGLELTLAVTLWLGVRCRLGSLEKKE